MFKIYTYTRYLFIFGLFFAFFVGCSKKDTGEEELSAVFNGNSAVFAWDDAGKLLRINTAENARWTITVSYPAGQPQDWCHANVTEGAGDRNVTVTVDKNTDDKKRTALITVALEATGAKVELPIEQTPKPPGVDLEFISGSSNFAWNTEGQYLQVTTTAADARWSLSLSYAGQPQGWCHIQENTGTGSKLVWVAVDQNPAATGSREALITATLETTGAKNEILVVQYGYDEEVPSPDVSALELPKVVDIAWFLNYPVGEFALEYAPTKKHSKWVAWRLHRGHLGSGRTDAWQFDPRIPPEYRPVREDFSGYDRGHLCPSADRNATIPMNEQTFMYSNMTPQNANLNQVIWMNLETRERGWASGLDTLYICAGGTVINDSDISHYTSPSNMAVPKYNFKVILRKKASTGAYDAIGFWFENRSYYPKTQVTAEEVKTVREIEARTGIDFFYNLPQGIQDVVENQRNPSAWGFTFN